MHLLACILSCIIYKLHGRKVVIEKGMSAVACPLPSYLLVSCGLGYTSGAAISQDLRGKDDETNHVMGAVCASGIAAAWCKSIIQSTCLIYYLMCQQ